MKKYVSLMRIRFVNTLQYRAAALAGAATQFAWGFMNLLMFRAFYAVNPAAFPMEFEQLASYIWVQQAFLALFSIWAWDHEVLDSIRTGQVAYELLRPMSIYAMWFTKAMAMRVSRALLRCVPILLVAGFFPAPYGLSLPTGALSLALFLISGALGLFMVCALSMLVYAASFYIINSYGLRILVVAVADLFTGMIIPLSFFPEGLKQVAMALPFAQVQDLPLRIYNGQTAGMEAVRAMGVQALWLAVLVLAGAMLMRCAARRTVVQGG